MLLSMLYYLPRGAHSGIIGWGSVLEGGSSWVQFSVSPLEFFSQPNPSSNAMPSGWLSISGIFLGVKGSWHVRLTVLLPSVCWLPRRCTSLNISVLWSSTTCYWDILTFFFTFTLYSGFFSVSNRYSCCVTCHVPFWVSYIFYSVYSF
jgi:hypothetical protein